MVGLKYRGKKDHLVYEGNNIDCGKMSWGQRGQIIQVSKEDAEEMVRHSPTDFEIILEGHEDFEPSIATLEKKDEFPETDTVFVQDEPDELIPDDGDGEVPDLAPEKNSLTCPYDGCDFVAKKPHGLNMHISRKHPKLITPVVPL